MYVDGADGVVGHIDLLPTTFNPGIPTVFSDAFLRRHRLRSPPPLSMPPTNAFSAWRNISGNVKTKLFLKVAEYLERDYDDVVRTMKPVRWERRT